MRGVPSFGRAFGRQMNTQDAVALSSNNQVVDDTQVDLSRVDPSQGAPFDEDEPRQQEVSTTATSPLPPPPIMLPRSYANRRGETFEIPRGVPLPPPLLALVNVRMCNAAISEGECSNIGNANSAKGGEDGSKGLLASPTLDCTWCTSTASCVPTDMRGVMC